ncbi:capsid protein [Paenibacillus polymyxa]|nr:capsid protein [Paenibacillus polymyxa]
MALRQIMLAKKIQQRKAALEELLGQERSLQTRSDELESAIEEAATDEEIAAVEESVTELEQEKTGITEQKGVLEGEIAALEGELEQLNSQAPDNTPNPLPTPAPSERNHTQTGGETRMRGNKYETRAQTLERLNQPEVRDFYSALATAVKENRALTGADATIPTVVIDMIRTRIGDFSRLYKEVEVVPLNGDARVILDGAIPEAIWVEMCDPVQELADAFTQTELDGFKVGGFIPLCNAILEDSMIDLANFVERRLAMAIGKALDKAILIGAGPTAKQPLGVVTALASEADRNVEVDGSIESIVTKMALIDDGEDGAPIEEVIAVMRRSTYYKHIVPQTLVKTADGRVVVQTVTNPMLPDGTRIVWSQYAPADTIILGDFKKYLLAERAGVKIESSKEVRFIQDQTVFKGTGRYDGKPVYTEYFAVIKITVGGAQG